MAKNSAGNSYTRGWGADHRSGGRTRKQITKITAIKRVKKCDRKLKKIDTFSKQTKSEVKDVEIWKDVWHDTMMAMTLSTHTIFST